MEFIFLIMAFLVGGIVSYLLGNYLLNLHLNKRMDIIRADNLNEIKPLLSRSEELARSVMTYLVKFSMDEAAWESSNIRIRFLNAGLHSDLIVLIYFGCKTVLTFLLPVLFYVSQYFVDNTLSSRHLGLIALLLAILGYYTPNLMLGLRIRSRKREIFENFPDALDLIRVCVSAGLGLDAAIAKVGEGLVISSHVLAEEFHLLSLELRAGATRDKALRNLAVRTGVSDINALVAMLIQAEKFGTSVSDSLHVHAETLRSKRQIRAQEKAAKIPVLLTLPMVLCILPSLFVVVLGPPVLNIIKNLPVFLR